MILIGSPPSKEGGNYFVKVLNSGMTMDAPTPRDFHDWDEEGFKTKILAHFVHFLLHTSGPSSAYFLSMALTGALINTLYYLHRPNLT